MSTSPSRNSTVPTASAEAAPPVPAGQRRFRGLAPEERQHQRRAQLMEAGIEVFGTRGFHAAGVREICAQAKLTERYFYESFQNREALFLAVYGAATARIEKALVDAIMGGQGDGNALTRAGLRAVLQLFKQEPRIARIVLVEVLKLGTLEAPLAASQTFANAIEQLSTALYPELKDKGFDTRILANGLYGSTLYIAQRWTISGFEEPLEEVLEHCALFYEGLAFKMGADTVLPVSAAPTSAPTRRHEQHAKNANRKHDSKPKPRAKLAERSRKPARSKR